MQHILLQTQSTKDWAEFPQYQNLVDLIGYKNVKNGKIPNQQVEKHPQSFGPVILASQKCCDCVEHTSRGCYLG